MFDNPICFAIPRRLTQGSAWQEHIPFAMWLVDVLRPGVIVELGTRHGDSYCAFCQAAQELQLATRCHGVGTWQDDRDTGCDGSEVLDNLRAHHDVLYGSFSRLIRSTFEDALPHFADGTVDLLHVAGHHRDEATRERFAAWMPKMSGRGVVLVDDVNGPEPGVRGRGLWGKLKSRYPHFELAHGGGLGVCAVGEHYPETFRRLLESSEEVAGRIREYFSGLGNRLTLQMQLEGLEHERSRLRLEADHLTREIAALQGRRQAQEAVLEEKAQQVEEVRADTTEVKAKRGRLAREAVALQARVEVQEQTLREQERELGELRGARDLLVPEGAALRARAQAQRQELDVIHASFGWRLLERYWQLKNSLLVPGSRRRVAYDAVVVQARRHLGKLGRLVERRGSGTTLVSRRLASADPAHVEKALDEDVTVSVVIPVKNAGEGFRNLLATLKNQRGLERIEIIVVDSESTDGSRETAAEYGARVVRIAAEEFSHSHARNVGAAYATGDYILFTVQDALPPSGSWLRDLVGVMKSRGVVAVSCAEYPREDTDLFYSVQSWNHHKFLEVDGRDRVMSRPDGEDYVSLRKNGQLTNLACLISTTVFGKYLFRGDFGEDLDLGIRLVRDGYRLAFLGSTRIVHSHNRPAYYHMRRGYVDRLTLHRLLPDCPSPSVGADQLFHDIVLSYKALKTLVEVQLGDVAVPCTVGDFSRAVTEKLKSAAHGGYPERIDLADRRYLDERTLAFVERALERERLGRERRVEHGGVLLDAMRTFGSTMCAFMTEAYEMVDEDVLDEVRACLCKDWAFEVGTHFAVCFFQGDDRTKERLKEIDTELSSGV